MNNAAEILVVDDDPDIGLMLKTMLDYNGYAAMISASAAQSEKTLRENGIYLLIIDMFLSGTNGVDLCKKFKKDNELSGIPVLMMSAHTDANTPRLAAGADDL